MLKTHSKDRFNLGYSRVSLEKQTKKGISLEAQEEQIKVYCTQRNLEPLEIIREEGESAKSLLRPGMQRVLSAVQDGKVGTIITYKLDRLFRNTTEALATADLLQQRDVALISVTEQIDTSTPSGRFFFTILAAMATWEREMISTRTREVMNIMRTQGRRTSSVPFGYDLVDGNRLIPNEAEWQVIREAVERRQHGETFEAIANEFMRRGIRTKEGQSRWYGIQISRLVRRPEEYGVAPFMQQTASF